MIMGHVFNIPKHQDLLSKLHSSLSEHDLSIDWINKTLMILMNQKKMSNSKFIKVFQKELANASVKIKTTKLYEIISQVLGERNWNVAKSKHINFYRYFFTIKSYHKGFKCHSPSLNKAFPEGFYSSEVVNLIGPTNSGKTRFAIKLAVDLALANNHLKIKHVQLEGDIRNNDIAHLTDVLLAQYQAEGYSLSQDISVDFFQPQEFNYNIEDLEEYLYKESEKVLTSNLKEKLYNILVIDHPQLLGTRKSFLNFADEQKYINERIHHIAIKSHCILIAPVVSTRVETHNLETPHHLSPEMEPTIIAVCGTKDGKTQVSLTQKEGEFRGHVNIGSFDLKTLKI